MRPLLLASALVLGACAATPPEILPPAAPLTQPGAVLSYEVVAGAQTYPFVVSVMQNDAAGTAFGFDLGDGWETGTVAMTPAAREAAPQGMLNAFESLDYTLDDQTSVWMARSDFRRLRAGETVAITVDDTAPVPFQLDTCTSQRVLIDGAPVDLPTCRFEGAGDRFVVVADDPQDPLILDMDAGPFRVTYRAGTR